jgi:hypothetical protein
MAGPAADDEDEEQPDQCEQGNVEDDLSGPAPESRLTHHTDERQHRRDAQEETVEPGNRRQTLVAQQRDPGGMRRAPGDAAQALLGGLAVVGALLRPAEEREAGEDDGGEQQQ